MCEWLLSVSTGSKARQRKWQIRKRRTNNVSSTNLYIYSLCLSDKTTNGSTVKATWSLNIARTSSSRFAFRTYVRASNCDTGLCSSAAWMWKQTRSCRFSFFIHSIRSAATLPTHTLFHAVRYMPHPYYQFAPIIFICCLFIKFYNLEKQQQSGRTTATTTTTTTKTKKRLVRTYVVRSTQAFSIWQFDNEIFRDCCASKRRRRENKQLK